MSTILEHRPIDAVIAACLFPGFSLASRTYLRRHGVSKRCLRRRLADGRMTELWKEVLAWGAVPDPILRDVLLAAAVLGAGTDGALYGTAALEQLGAWPATRNDGSIDVLASRMVRPVRRWRIRYHQSGARDVPTVMHGRIRCCVPVVAAFQAAGRLTPHQLTFVLRNLAYHHGLTIEEFARFVAHRQGHRHVRTARRAIELYNSLSAGTKSRSEDRALGPLSAAFGEPIVNVFGAAGIPDYEPDFVWVVLKLIVEIDGGPHLDDPVTIARDRARDRRLRDMGWTIIRVHWRDTFDMRAVIARIKATIGS